MPCRLWPRARFVDRVRAALRRKRSPALLGVLLLLPALAIVSPRAASQGRQATPSAAPESAPSGSQPASSPATGSPSAAPPAASQPATPLVPVIVELFTAEGCSTCPPADALLAALDLKQPIPGAEILPLEEHVDYWDQDGWRDPFDSSAYTQRQQVYAWRFHLPSPYTPEMVVDGRAEFGGGSYPKARAAILQDLKTPRARVSVSIAKGPDPNVLHATVHVEDYPPGVREKAELRLAVTEDGLASDVHAGENSGKHLEHRAVVRRILSAGHVQPDRPFSEDVKIPLDRGWNVENLRIVAFLEGQSTHQILGAASSRVSP
jgi:hypothetical protein